MHGMNSNIIQCDVEAIFIYDEHNKCSVAESHEGYRYNLQTKSWSYSFVVGSAG